MDGIPPLAGPHKQDQGKSMTTALKPAAPEDTAQQFQQATLALSELVAQKPEMEKLLGEMVRLCGQALSATAAGVWVTETPDNPELIMEHNLRNLGLMQENRTLPGLVIAVRRTAREGKPLIVPPFFVDNEANDLPVNPSQYELLLTPIRVAAKIAMVLTMAVPATSDGTRHRTQLNFLQRMIASVETAMTQGRLQLMEKDHGKSGKLLQFTHQIHQHLHLQEVAVDVATLVRSMVDAQRATVELYPRLRKKIVAVSNVDSPNRRAAIFEAQRLILDYVRDRHVPVMLDRDAAKQLVSDPALQDAAAAYFTTTAFDAFAAAPIKHDDKIIGVILAEYSTTENAQQHSTELSELARLATTSVTNALQYEAIPFRRSLHALSQLWRKPTASKRCIAYSIIGLLAITASLLCIPCDFALKADCTVQPVVQLNVVAPMDGRIINVRVRAGQHVYALKDKSRLPAGTVISPLVEFDTTDLRASLAEQQGKEAELLVQLKDVQSRGEMSKIGAAQLQLKQIQEQIALLNHQIDQATVYSPFEGTVLTEHPEQKKWASARLGEPLMDVASFSEWVLVVDVSESDVAVVRNALEKAAQTHQDGISVEYIFYPWPDQKYTIKARGLPTLLPASSVTSGKNVFHLQIPVNPSELPPGIAMSGVTGRAKIHVGKEGLLVQWTRGVRRLLEMTAFF
jgi:GAF domain-containing protein